MHLLCKQHFSVTGATWCHGKRLKSNKRRTKNVKKLTLITCPGTFSHQVSRNQCHGTSAYVIFYSLHSVYCYSTNISPYCRWYNTFEITLSFLVQIEADFRENALRTLSEIASNNRTDYLDDWNEVQRNVCIYIWQAMHVVYIF